MQGDAGRVVIDFAGQNKLQKVHALDGVRLTQNAAAGSKPTQRGMGSGPQDFELTAPAMDFLSCLRDTFSNKPKPQAPRRSRSLRHGTGASSSRGASPPQRTVVTAGKFLADFVVRRGQKPSHQRPRCARMPAS